MEVVRQYSHIRIKLQRQQSQDTLRLESEVQAIENQIDRLLDRLASAEIVRLSAESGAALAGQGSGVGIQHVFS